MSLKLKTINSIFWTIIDSIFVKLIPLFSTFYIARIISPSDFGLIATVSLIFQLSLLIIDSGISSSLIRTPNTSQKDYSTLFYFNIFLALFLFILFYFISPFIANYLEQNRLIFVIKIYGLCVIIVSLSSIQNAIFCKELKFKQLTIISFLSTILSSILGIYLAKYGYEYKSILFMQLSNQLFFTIFIWIISSWRPKLVFCLETLKKHLNFGYKLLLSGFINVSYREIYKLIIAKKFTMESVGFFDRARTLNDYPNVVFSSVFTKVMFPVFSKILHDNETNDKSNFLFINIYRINNMIFIPLATVFVALSDNIVLLTLGKEWMETSYYFKLISIASAFYTTHNISVNIIKSYGRSDWFLKMEIIKKVFFVSTIIISINFGIKALMYSIVLNSIIELFINGIYIDRLINYSLKKLFMDMFPNILFSILVFYFIKFILLISSNSNTVFQLFFALFSTLILFVVYHFLFKTILYNEALKLVNKKQ